MKILYVLAFALLAGCAKQPIPHTLHTVVMIGDCTESTGGWGGTIGRCRVEFDDGDRATVQRPVNLGDTIQCREGGRTVWHCRVL